PPVTIDARPAPALAITGARADLAYAQALRVQEHLSLAPAELEIEYAIPRGMGLSSEAMLGLTVARTLAALAEHPAAGDSAALAAAAGLTPADSLARWGFDSGGLLLT